MLLLLALSSVVSALDPKKSITQYIHNVYGPEQGLPQQQISAILQTHDSYLWMATVEGLVRFDGVRFTTFDTKNTPELKQSYIWTLYEDQDGALWIGTAGGGISRYKNGKFTSYTTKEGLAHDRVGAIAGTKDGSLWIGTIGGLSRYKDGKFVTYTTDDGLRSNNVKSLHADDNGNLWIGTTGGLNLLKDGSITVYDVVDNQGK